MADLSYEPIPHKHDDFLARAKMRPGFSQAYENLRLEYEIVNQMIQARTRAGLTQEAVAERMGTTKSAISRLESPGKHAPSLSTLQRYAAAVDCELEIRLVQKQENLHSPQVQGLSAGMES